MKLLEREHGGGAIKKQKEKEKAAIYLASLLLNTMTVYFGYLL